MRGSFLVAGLMLALATLTACGGGEHGAAPTPGEAKSVAVTSHAFAEGADIPADYSCDGSGGSPDLEWTGIPPGAKSLVILANDPDAGNFVHWLVYGIPPETVEIAVGISNEPELADGSRQGKNSFGDVGYGPLCPPKGSKHTYQFFVYALDIEVTLGEGAGEEAVTQAMNGHILGWGELTGEFGR
jgi:Raf kinase inhibitor-like YbhB/YbcL family protein